MVENVYKDIFFSMNEVGEIITSALNSKTGNEWQIKNRFRYLSGKKSAKIEYYATQACVQEFIKSYLITPEGMIIFEEVNRDRHIDYRIRQADASDYQQKKLEPKLFNTLTNNGSIVYLGSKEVPISTKSDFYNLLSDYSAECNYLDTENGFFQFPNKYDKDLNLKIINFVERKKYQKTHLS